MIATVKRPQLNWEILTLHSTTITKTPSEGISSGKMLFISVVPDTCRIYPEMH